MTRLEKSIKVLKSLGMDFTQVGDYVTAYSRDTARRLFELTPCAVDDTVFGGSPDATARNVEAYKKFKAAFDSWVEPLPGQWKVSGNAYESPVVVGFSLAWLKERPKAHRDAVRQLFDYLDKQESNK